MTSDAGVPGAPRFDVVLRGYDRRQVDEHVDRLQRVLARMRADLEVARSQPMPAVAPSRPAAARPRPTPRPRPGGPADNPDTIGNFTDRMETILQSAEEEAAEIRRNAHLAARAETDGVRSQVADLIRQRDAVLAELTRMRSQLEGLLAAPTAQMPVHESGRYGRPDPGQRPDPVRWPSDQGFRPAGGPGADPVHRAGPAPSAGPQPPTGPAPSGAPRPTGPATSTPASPASASPTSADPSSGTTPGTPVPPGPTPSVSAGTPNATAPAGSAPQKPGTGGAYSAGATPVSTQAVSSTSISPMSVTPGSASPKPGSSPAPGGQDSSPAAHGAPAAGSPSSTRPSAPGTPPTPSSARPPAAPSTAAPAPAALPAGQGGTPPERRADARPAGAGDSSGKGTPAGSDAGTGSPPVAPEREARKAAHRLPTGAYPAVGDSSSMRPRSEPDAEPADLFRPARGGGPDPQTTAVPRSTGDTPGERTSVVRREERTERDATPTAAESTTKVGSVRAEEPTVLSPQPATGRPEHGDGRNGSSRPTSPSRSA